MCLKTTKQHFHLAFVMWHESNFRYQLVLTWICQSPNLSSPWQHPLSRSHFGHKLAWNISIVGFWCLKKMKKKKSYLNWSFFKSANSNEFAPPNCNLMYCVCVFVWMPVLTLTDMPLQWLRWTFNYMGSKSLHYKRAGRMKGWKSKGE